jgi:competence protein ComEC
MFAPPSPRMRLRFGRPHGGVQTPGSASRVPLRHLDRGSRARSGAGPADGDPRRELESAANRLSSLSRPADLRLLVPALSAWASVALLLGSSPACVALVAAGSCVIAGGSATAWWRQRRLSPDEGPPASAEVSRMTRAPVHVFRGCPGPLTWLGTFTLAALGTSLALSALAASSSVRDAGPLRDLADQRATVAVVGVVASDPRAVHAPRGRQNDADGVVLRLDVEQIDSRGVRSAVASPVLVFGDPSWLGVSWRSRVVANGRLAPAEDAADDVVAVLTPRGPPRVIDGPGVIATAAEVVRNRFADATDGLPSDARGLLPGLVIGDTSRTPEDLDEAMLVTGMTHLSAVSGSNVAIVLAAALGLAAFLGLRRRWRPPLAAVLLLLFVVLVRPEPSVVRAGAMGAVGLLGVSTSRRRAGLPALSVAVLTLLVWDPWLARSAGFSLSTLATLGLLLFAGPWGAAIGRLLPTRIQCWGPALAVPVAAQLMCAPIIVLLQSSVSVVGVVANLLAAPFLAPATVLGVATALVSVVSTTVAGWIGWLAAVPTLAIAQIARTAANAPVASVPWPGTGVGAAALAVFGVLLVVTGPWLAHQARRRPLLPVGAALLGIGAAVPTQVVTWPLTGWGFVACDVGQGDGLVLATGVGRAVVVDAGPDPATIDGCLRRLRIDVVEAVVLTHFHADHVDGLPGIMRGRTVRQILTTPVRDPPYQWQEVSEWAAAAKVPIDVVFAGDDLAWPGLTAHVWWPARVIHEGSVPNNASVVLTVDVGGLRLLLLADVEREAAHQVLLSLQRQARAPPVFDVVKVAHHGSANRDDALLAYVRAAVAVVSVGVDNDYGHPASSTLRTLLDDGYQVYRTDVSGDVAVRKGESGAVEVATLR